MAKLHHSGIAPARGRLPGSTDTSMGAGPAATDAPIFVALVLGLFAFFFALARSEDVRKADAEKALETALPHPLAVLRAAPEGETFEPAVALFSKALAPVGADLVSGADLPVGVAAAVRLNTGRLFVGRTAALEPEAAKRIDALAKDLPDIGAALRAGGLLQVQVRSAGRSARHRRLAARRAEVLAARLGEALPIRAGIAAETGWHTVLLLEGSGGR